MSNFNNENRSSSLTHFSRGIKCLLCFLFCWLTVAGQTSLNKRTIDSLEQILDENPEDIAAYYALASSYTEIDSTLAFQNAKKGLEHAKGIGNLFLIGKGRFTLASLYLDYNKPLKAEYFYRAADTVLTKLIARDSSDVNLKLWVRANFNIGVALSYQGISADIEYLEKITPVAEKIGFHRILAVANSNLGINFYNLRQFQKAYKYFKTSGVQYEKIKDYDTYLEDRFIFVSCLVDMDSMQRAKTVLDRIGKIMDTVDQVPKKQTYHLVLGQYNHGIKDFEQAIVNYQKAEALLKTNQVVRNGLQLQLEFMKTYAAMENYEKASEYAAKAIELSVLNKNSMIEAEVNRELSSFQFELGKRERAYQSLRRYVTISDSLNLAELEKEVNRLETKYQSEKKERDILQLTNANNEVELLLTKKQSQNYLLLLVSLSLLFLALLAYLGYRNFKKRDRIKANALEKLKLEQESRTYNAILEGQEKERQRLAADLHDGLAGRLSALKMNLEKLAKKADSKKNEQSFRGVAKHIDAALFELRSIARNLMPETLFRYGLEDAIKDYCASLNYGRNTLEFILQFYDGAQRLPQATYLTLYRIIQELINNAVKHSEATEILVQYVVDGDKVTITVEDNGTGFKNDKREVKGMGLHNLKTRVAYLNGTIDFDSVAGEGTNVHIEIPM